MAASSKLYISVVIPAFNEEKRLPKTLLETADYFDQRGVAYEIIAVSDGSSDGTSSIVLDFKSRNKNIDLIELEQNMGKGCAVRTGVMAAQGERILFADADGSTPIVEVERLEREYNRGVKFCIGSRAVVSDETQVNTRWYRRFLGQAFNRVVNAILVPGIRDTQCGFKMFEREVARFLFSTQKANGFSFDVEILHLAQKANIEVAEVAVNWNNVPGSKVNLLLDAAKMFRDVLIFKFIHRKVGPPS